MATVILFIMSGSIIIVGLLVLALTFWHWNQKKIEKIKSKEALETKLTER